MTIAVVGCALSISGAGAVSAGSEQLPPSTTVPAATTSSSGAFVTTSVGPGTTSAGLYPTCEAALLPEDSTEPCDEVLQLAFDNFGDQLGALYAPELDAQLGAWAPIGDHDSQLNRNALLACQYLVEDYSEIGWLEYASEIPDLTTAEHEALFDVVMTHICPGLGYTRQFEWDNYIPFTLPGEEGDTTTTVAGGDATTTLAAPTTTLVNPSTTSPAQTTAIATITVQGTPTSFNCTSIAYPFDYINASATDDITEASVCGTADEQLFAQIIGADPQAFEDFVYSPNIGVFAGAEYTVESTAWIGFAACSLVAAGEPYSTFDNGVRNVFAGVAVPQPTPADTQLAYDEALRVLCPFLTTG